MASEYPTSIRLPEDVRRGFRRWARHNKRSLTREIVYVLASWLENNPAPGGRAAKEPAAPAEEAK